MTNQAFSPTAQVKFSAEKPPIYEQIHARFPHIDWEAGVAITFGDTIYSKYKLHPAVYVHEYEHIKQQAGQNPVNWVEMYLSDPKFRLSVEIEAYQAQMKFIREAVKDRNQRYSLMRHLAVDMSGPMYGNMCTLAEAIEYLQ